MKQLSIITFLLLSSIILVPRLMYSQCPGNLYIYSQAEVDSFPKRYPNCTSIPGEVEIIGDVSNLVGLSSIISIGGSLDIRDADNLTSLSGLDNLSQVKYIAIRESDNIADVSALNNLSSFKGITIQNTKAAIPPSFENISSSVDFIRIIDNAQLQQVNMPPNVHISSYVQIYRNAILQTISGFEGFVGGGGGSDDLDIRENDELLSIKGFGNLMTVRNFGIKQCTKLNSIPSFQNLKTIRNWLVIEKNSKLESIDGFNALEQASSITFQENGLREIHGFNNLEKVEYSLNVFFEENLESISPFKQLKKAGDIRITNTGLEEIDVFSSLDSMGFLLIRENAKLFSVEGFENLKQANIGVTLNPMLSDCSAFCKFKENSEFENWGGFTNNAPGCNSLMEVDSTCLDTIGDIHVFDVILNTFNGNHSIEELEDVSLEIYEGDELKETYFSDLEGLVSVDLNKLDSLKEYRLEAYLGADAVVKMKFDKVTLEMLAQDTFRIEYPDRLMDTIISLQNQLKNKKAKADYASGTLTLEYNLKGYKTEAIDIPIMSFTEISANHQNVVKAMKRMGIGLHAINLYLDDGIDFSKNMSKAFAETTLGLFKLAKELLVVKKGFDDLPADKLADIQLEAVNNGLTSLVKLIYGLTKNYYINAKIAALENNKDSKELAASIKKALVVIEASMFGVEGLAEATFVDVVHNALGQHLIEQFYIASATQEQLNGLASSHQNIDIGFPFLVNNTNQVRSTTENLNFNANLTADALGGLTGDISNLAELVDNVGLVLIIASVGVGSPLGVGMRALATGMKAGVISMNGFNFYSYSNRLSFLPFELEQITSQFTLNPSYNSGQYDQEFLEQLVADLDIQFFIQLLDNIDTALTNNDFTGAASEYIIFNQYYGRVFQENLHTLLNVTTNMGSVAHLNGDPDDALLQIEKEFRRIEAQKMMVDFNLIAHIADLESDTLVNLLNSEIDTLQTILSEFPNKMKLFFSDFASGDYPPLISIVNVNYPDTFLLAPFKAEIKLQNLGPLTSESFTIKLSPNEHCTLNVLDSQLEDLVLASGEEKVFEIEVTPLTEDRQNSIYLEFENVRGIDESIIFIFNDQELAFDVTSSIVDVPIAKQEQVIFPNPARGKIFVKSEFFSELQDYQIFNLDGRIMKKGIISASAINVQGLPAGIYSVLLNGKDRAFVEKLVIQ